MLSVASVPVAVTVTTVAQVLVVSAPVGMDAVPDAIRTANVPLREAGSLRQKPKGQDGPAGKIATTGVAFPNVENRSAPVDPLGDAAVSPRDKLEIAVPVPGLVCP